MNNFHAAADLMERCGRLVGDLGDEERGFCFVGAFYYAGTGNANDGEELIPRRTEMRVLDDMYAWGWQRVREITQRNPVFFSDKAETDAEVVAMLRQLGDEWDARQEAAEAPIEVSA